MWNTRQSYGTLGSLEKDSRLPPHPPTFCPVAPSLDCIFDGCLPVQVPHTHSRAASVQLSPCNSSHYSHQWLSLRQTFVFIYLGISVACVPADDILLGHHNSTLSGVSLLPFPWLLLTFLHRFLFLVCSIVDTRWPSSLTLC